MTNAKLEIKQTIKEHLDELFGIAKKMYENPEMGFKEFKAAQWLTEKLEKEGFEVKREIAGLETAFSAEYDLGGKGPNIAFLCEYDALPGIGHGCGHNLIGPSSLGAAIALSKVGGLSGKITVLGCPAEETGGAKVILVEKGLFDEVDVAMMVHPATRTQVYTTSYAIDAIEFTYHGQTSHAAAAPELGINALDAVIQLFNGINALRQHLKDDVRIHGIISDGGKTPNVVPDLASARFYFRAKDRKYLNEMFQKILKIAEGAALMTGAKMEWRNYELSNDNLAPNRRLAELFEANLIEQGITDIEPPQEGKGSTDMGNVSHVVPAIHPYLPLAPKDSVRPHSIELAEATVSANGKDELYKAALILACTGYDILNDEEVFEEILAEFRNK
ncbi:MAG TPA: M20 family metallopeptidase [Thermotogota bacterium]|nr:M20 family metallopeptidase [Thermotogota bacterium]HPJ89208.1 M20 family metallopeptidase [Thermotogota bacterium]HPR96404.1 M20 family metallopeptidase [Thermotogota bacterium]